MIDEFKPVYKPPLGLSNPHLQNLLSSSGFRRRLIACRHRRLLRKSQVMTLDCGGGVRLLGEFNETTSQSKGLVILLHGWEGSSRAGYMLSAATALLHAGFDVFRLNLRDHGDSHHLNHGLFHSALEEEVFGALKAVQTRWHSKPGYYLAGFSLGGNFSLRMALKSEDLPAPLNHVLAVCPVLDPARSMAALESGWRIYETYFTRKWKKSLRKKLNFFGSYDYGGKLPRMTRLRQMNEFFIPRYTSLQTVEHYYASYTLTSGRLNTLKTPSTLLMAADDPVIPADDLVHLPDNPHLAIELAHRGGHCAFLDSWRLTSWADKRMVELLQGAAAEARLRASRNRPDSPVRAIATKARTAGCTAGS